MSGKPGTPKPPPAVSRRLIFGVVMTLAVLIAVKAPPDGSGAPVWTPAAILGSAGAASWVAGRRADLPPAVIMMHWVWWLWLVEWSLAAVLPQTPTPALIGAAAVGPWWPGLLSSDGWTFGVSFVAVAILALIGDQVTQPGDKTLERLRRLRHPHRAMIEDLINAHASLRNGRLEIVDFDITPDHVAVIEVVPPPGSGVTENRIADIAAHLPADLRLKPGCSVHTRPGHHQGAVIIELMLRPPVVDDKPRKAREIGVRSFADPLPLGVRVGGGHGEVSTEDLAWVLANRGVGKSGLVHEVVAAAAECNDVVIFAICAGKRGGTFARWVAAWARGEAEKPTINWLARDPKTAFAIAESALAIAEDRISTYAPLAEQHDSDNIPISPKVPAIFIAIDEPQEIFGDEADREWARVARVLLKVGQKGRQARVWMLSGSSRTTGSYMPSDLRTLIGTRIVGPVEESEAEVAHFLGWDTSRRLDLSQLSRRGEFWVIPSATSGQSPYRIRTERWSPMKAIAHSKRTAGIRPELDAPSAEVVHDSYATRWTDPDTVGWLRHIATTGGDAEEPSTRPAADPDPDPEPEPEIVEEQPRPVGLDPASIDALVASMPASLDDWPVAEGVPAAVATVAGPPLDMPAAERALVESAARSPDLPQMQALVLAIVVAGGRTGRTAAEVNSEVPGDKAGTRPRVYEALNALRRKGLVEVCEGTPKRWRATL